MAEITRLNPLQLSRLVRDLIQVGRTSRQIVPVIKDLGFTNPVREIQRVVRTITAQEKARGLLQKINPSRVIPPELFTPSLLNLSQKFGYTIRFEYVDPLTGERKFQHITVLSSRRLTPQTAIQRATDVLTAQLPIKRTPTVPEENILNSELVSAEEREG